MSFIPSAVSRARCLPYSFNGISEKPCTLRALFQSVSPCRTMYNLIFCPLCLLLLYSILHISIRSYREKILFTFLKMQISSIFFHAISSLYIVYMFILIFSTQFESKQYRDRYMSHLAGKNELMFVFLIDKLFEICYTES